MPLHLIPILLVAASPFMAKADDFSSRERMSREEVARYIDNAEAKRQAEGAAQITHNLSMILGREVVKSGSSDWRTPDGEILCRATADGLGSNYYVQCRYPNGANAGGLVNGQIDPRQLKRAESRIR